MADKHDKSSPRAPRNWTIEAQAKAVRHLREILGNDADDDGLLLDMVEGETDFLECLDRLLSVIADHEAMATGAEALASSYSTRSRAAKEKVAQYKALVETAMMHAELGGPVRRPGGTVSLRNNLPKLKIEDEEEIPSQFFKPQPPKLDAAGLKAALKDSEDEIPGAQLVPGGQSLTIRR